MKTLVCIHCLILAMASLAAEEPSPRPNIRVQTQMIEMSLESFVELSNSPVAMSPHAIAQRFIHENKAKLIDSNLVICQHEQDARLQSFKELIYPSELTGSGISGSFTDEDHKKLEASMRTLNARFILPSFESREVGEFLEIEASIKDDRILLRFAGDSVTNPEYLCLLEQHDQHGWARVGFPIFETRRAYSTLHLANNRFTWINHFTSLDSSGKPDPNNKLLLFVKAELIHPSAP